MKTFFNLLALLAIISIGFFIWYSKVATTEQKQQITDFTSQFKQDLGNTSGQAASNGESGSISTNSSVTNYSSAYFFGGSPRPTTYPNLLNSTTFGLTEKEFAGFYEAFNNRKARPETNCWAVTFSLTAGSKARAYCLAATPDDAIAKTRTKVLSGKLERIEQVDVKAVGHNHELIAEVCVAGGVGVEIV
jgi:hypothetical protein